MSGIVTQFHVSTAAARLALARIDRNVDRASMWTVREAGRIVKREAKAKAPVWKGPGVTRKQLRNGPKVVSRNAPVKGLLKASIHSRKQLKKLGPGGYENAVAPRGDRVHLYSGKAEARHGYMAAASSAATARIPAIAAKAYLRATNRR